MVLWYMVPGATAFILSRINENVTTLSCRVLQLRLRGDFGARPLWRTRARAAGRRAYSACVHALLSLRHRALVQLRRLPARNAGVHTRTRA